MQRVITVHANLSQSSNTFKEHEWPELKKYLEDGYRVEQCLPTVSVNPSSTSYSLTFILEKR